MLNSVTMATYSKISQMTSTINTFISQAVIAKSNITMSANSTMSSQMLTGIGHNVDILV